MSTVSFSVPSSLTVSGNLTAQTALTTSALASALLRVDSSNQVQVTTLQSNLVLSSATLSLATALTSVNSITSAASSALTLATGTSGAAITIASATNRVGIGTVSPNFTLEVNGQVKALDYYLSNTGGSGNYRFDGNSDYLYIYGDTAGMQGFRFGGDIAGTLFQISNAGQVSVTATTASTSTTTGSAVFGGGVGVAGAGYFGGLVNIASDLIMSGILRGGGSGTYAIRSGASSIGLNIDPAANAVDVLGKLTVSYPTASTSSTTGALVVSGGAGFAKDVWINSVRVGRGAGDVNGNIAIGSASLDSNVAGGQNVSIGHGSQGLSTAPSSNTSVGYFSLRNNLTGTSNTAIGNYALNAALGDSNTAVGGSAAGTSTGATNTAIGTLALLNCGSGNVAIGYSAGRYETGSNSFYVDNQDRTNTAGDKAGALLYGTFNATATSQTLRVNAALSVFTSSLTHTQTTFTIYGPSNVSSTIYPMLVTGASSESAIAKFSRGGGEVPFYICAAQNVETILASEGEVWLKAGVTADTPFSSGTVGLKASTTAVTIPLATASTSSTTGALVVSGGVGIAGNAHVAGDIVCAGAGSTSQRYGSGSTAAGLRGVAIGYNAVSSGDDSMAIGWSTSATAQYAHVIGDQSVASGYASTVFGYNATGNFSGATAIGMQAFGGYASVSIGASSTTSAAGYAIAIGNQATVNGTTNFGIAIGNGATVGHSSSIAFGYGTTSTAANQLLFGGNDNSSITDVYFGKGVTITNPVAVTLNVTGASGTNIAGVDLNIAAGKATGNAAGGNIVFKTSDIGSTGTTLQSLTAKMTIGVSTISTTTGRIIKTASKTANYTLTTADHFVVFSGSTASQSLTLPAVSGTTGTIYIIKNRASVTVNIVTTASANEIFGVAATNSITLAVGDSATLISDGTYWTIN